MADDTTLSQNLAALEAQVAKSLQTAQRRSRRGLVLWLAVTVFTGGYLAFAHLQLTRVDPDMAVSFAGEKLKERLPDAFVELRKQGLEMAPVLVKDGQAALQTVPDRLHTALLAQVETQLDRHVPALEEQMYVRFKATLDAELAVHPRENQTREERYADLIARLHAHTQQFVAAQYEQYLGESSDILAHLDRLAANKDLSEAERMQRDMIRSMLILWRTHEAQSARTSG